LLRPAAGVEDERVAIEGLDPSGQPLAAVQENRDPASGLAGLVEELVLNAQIAVARLGHVALHPCPRRPARTLRRCRGSRHLLTDARGHGPIEGRPRHVSPPGVARLHARTTRPPVRCGTRSSASLRTGASLARSSCALLPRRSRPARAGGSRDIPVVSSGWGGRGVAIP